MSKLHHGKLLLLDSNSVRLITAPDIVPASAKKLEGPQEASASLWPPSAPALNPLLYLLALDANKIAARKMKIPMTISYVWIESAIILYTAIVEDNFIFCSNKRCSK
jgi:hypothetical protein